MRTTVLAALIGAGVVIAVVTVAADPRDAYAPRPGGSYGANRRPAVPVNGLGSPMPITAQATGQLVALQTTVGTEHQQVTVIDPAAHVMSVYHIDLATGQIALKSVRNIHWDLQLTYFDCASPLPQEIQAQLER